MTIVVGVDGSAVSQQALTWAIAEGRLRQETVCAIYAWGHAPVMAAGGRAFGPPAAETLRRDLDELQKNAERRLAETVAELGEASAVEQRAVQGHPVEVLVEQSRNADLLVVGSRGHGHLSSALLGSVSRGCTHHAECPVVVIRDPEHKAVRARAWHPDEVIARETAKSARTWEALLRLGVVEGVELALEFGYESGGPAADRVLAEFLRRETGYKVEVDPEGITGWTPPIPVSPSSLDEWVTKMVLAGHDHGGSIFDGWTATLSAGRSRRRAQDDVQLKPGR